MNDSAPWRGTKRRLRRGWKYLRHATVHTLAAGGSEARPVFVFGCQRSGTKMLVRTLDRSMATWVYPEYNRRAFDSDYRIRSFDRLEELIRRCRAPTVVFKPICDSHLADRILDRFGERRPCAFWIYRDFRDVVNSAVEKWGGHFARVMEAVSEGRREEVGWRGERLDDERVSQVEGWSRRGLSAEEGAAAFWYVRNHFFFDLGLHEDRRIALLRYEDLVRDPGQYLPSVFGFAGVRFEPRFGAHIHAGSVGRKEEPSLAPPLRSACESLRSRLDRAHEDGARDRGRGGA